MRTQILVVDDDPDLESLIRLHFRRKIQCGDYLFHFALSGRDAMLLIENGETFDIAMLAINLPDGDGIGLLSRISDKLPLSRTIMMTEFGDMSKIRLAMNQGAFDFISKPFDLQDLTITLGKTAEQAHLLRESSRLKKLDELKSHFFDNITHEFRTPLTLILAPVEKLLRNTEYTGDLRRYLHLIQRNGRQLLRTINQLLDLTKLEAGHLGVLPSPGNLGEFVGQLVQAFAPLAEERGLTITFENNLTEDYYFDAEKIEKILHNLIANALKFTSPDVVAGGPLKLKGQVTVKVSHSAGSVMTDLPDGWSGFSPVREIPLSALAADEHMHRIQLLVQDSGIGIQSAKLPYIFDRFYEVRPDMLRPDVALVPPSTGIGLSLVKELTELLGGTISVGSSIGQGTRFVVDVPLLPTGGVTNQTDYLTLPSIPVLDWPGPVFESNRTADIPRVPADEENSGVELPLVLVADDNAELREFIAEDLAGQYRVLTAADGREGWALAQSELPDVVISDILMPNINGHQLTHLIKTNPTTDHIAVILLTARATQPNMIEGLQHGADDYISKPFHLEELHLRLRNLLKRQQKLSEHYQQQLIKLNRPLPAETVQDLWLRSLYSLIEQHLDDPALSVEQLADHLSVSRRTLHRKVHSLTQYSPNELVRQYRIRRGAELLRAGHGVSDTAYLVGFEAPSYFSQCFKEVFQVTPSEYSGIVLRES